MTPPEHNKHQPSGRLKTAPGRPGFTLIEILIATALAATLMLGIWSLMNIYLGLFERGHAKAEKTQLVRALTQQLTDDLHGAIQDPIPGLPVKPPGPVRVRRFGLFGTRTELRFDVLQLTPFQVSLTPDADAADSSFGEPLRAPELRTVYYRFEQSTGLTDDRQLVQPGFSRRELDFETPFPEDDEFGDGVLGSPPSQSLDPLDAAGSSSSEGLMVVDPNDDSVMLAPEVTSLAFSYFDGTRWSSSWNSLDRKSLPVAVEVTMQLGTLADREEEFAAESTDGDPLAMLVPEEPNAGRDTRSTHRLVIDIPGAPMYRAPEKTKSRVSRLKPRPVQVRPRPTGPRKPANMPDQWMRTER